MTLIVYHLFSILYIPKPSLINHLLSHCQREIGNKSDTFHVGKKNLFQAHLFRKEKKKTRAK